MRIILDYCQKGIPIFFDKEKQIVSYKDFEVSRTLLLKSFLSPLDRIELTPKLTMVKNGEFIQIGCLTLTKTKIKHFIKLCQK